MSLCASNACMVLAWEQSRLCIVTVHAIGCFEDICVSEFQMIAMISNSDLIVIPLMLIMKESLMSDSEPAIIDWNKAALIASASLCCWLSARPKMPRSAA